MIRDVESCRLYPHRGWPEGCRCVLLPDEKDVEALGRLSRWFARVECGSSFEAAAIQVYGEPRKARSGLMRDLRRMFPSDA